MPAEIVSIGDELMEGRVRDTNAPFIASRLVGRGIATARFTAVPDRAEAIAGALGEALQRGADPILVTGGLGPTSDDITREAAAGFIVPMIARGTTKAIIAPRIEKTIR